jgi:hypothetical protein
MTMAALAAPALAEDWKIVETRSEAMSFKVAVPPSWNFSDDFTDGIVTKNFFHMEDEPFLRRELATSSGFHSTKSWRGNPADLPEPALGAYAAHMAKEMTAGRSGVAVYHDVVRISGVNAIRMVMESYFQVPAGQFFEQLEFYNLAYARKSDGRPVILQLYCHYIGRAADRSATERRFQAERGPICERFAGSLVILEGGPGR